MKTRQKALKKDSRNPEPASPKTLPQLKQSFRTTNCIESLNSMVAQLTRNVKRWTNSNQRSRWLATALLDIEPRLRRVKGYRSLPKLRRALQKDL